MTVATGLDRLARGDLNIKGRKVGLLTHPASVDRRLVHAKEIVRSAGAELIALFGPEHGLDAAAQDMIGVAAEQTTSGPRIHSLYGEYASDLAPRPSHLEGIDLIIVDLQDVGSRYYTYVWTTAFMLRVAARLGVEVMVLDRPNPLGGDVVEGAPQRPGYRSFIGAYEVATRHGMTIGEIATMVREHERLDEASLTVVKMDGWKREMLFTETGLPWVLPSPNMPTPDTAIVYPGGCLIEGTTMSEGRGTTRPFEIFGAPGVDPRALAELEVEGATLRPLRFEPTFQKHAKQSCGGVQVHVHDRARFRSVEAYYRLIARAIPMLPEEQFPWRTEEYEYETKRPAIDLLAGGPAYRQLVNDRASLEDYLAKDKEGAARFAEARAPWLLY